jgi:hypothetical protein
MAKTTSEKLLGLLMQWTQTSGGDLSKTICVAMETLFETDQIDEFYKLVKRKEKMYLVIDRIVYTDLRRGITQIDEYRHASVNCAMLLLLKCIKERYFEIMAYHALGTLAKSCGYKGQRIELAQKTITALSEHVGCSVEFWISKHACENFVGALGTDDEIINRYWQIQLILGGRFKKVTADEIHSALIYFDDTVLETGWCGELSITLHDPDETIDHLIGEGGQASPLGRLLHLLDAKKEQDTIKKLIGCMGSSTSVIRIGRAQVSDEFEEACPNLFVSDANFRVSYDKFLSDNRIFKQESSDLFVPRTKRIKHNTNVLNI